MKPVSKELSEICYPFIYEDSPVCDFEITADELCSRIGLVLAMDLDEFSRDILTRMQPNVYHLNGSVRGKLAITEAEVEEELTALLRQFNLPIQSIPIPTEDWIAVMKKDKKKSKGLLHLVALKEMGQAVVRPVEYGLIEEFLKEVAR